MTARKFGTWIRGGKSDVSPRKWVVRLRMIERRMERQRQKLKMEEKKGLKEVEKAVQAGDMDAAKLFARDVAKSRKMALGCMKLNSRIKTMTFKLEQATAVQSIGKDMVGLVRALRGVNETLRIPELTNIMGAMEMEMEKLDMTSETIDEGFEMADFSEAEDEDVEKIIGEISAGQAAVADMGLPTPDIRSQELASELEKLKKRKA